MRVWHAVGTNTSLLCRHVETLHFGQWCFSFEEIWQRRTSQIHWIYFTYLWRRRPCQRKNRFVWSYSRQGLFLFFVLPPVWELVTARNFLFMQGTALDLRHRSVAHHRAVCLTECLKKSQEQIKHTFSTWKSPQCHSLFFYCENATAASALISLASSSHCLQAPSHFFFLVFFFCGTTNPLWVQKRLMVTQQ